MNTESLGIVRSLRDEAEQQLNRSRMQSHELTEKSPEELVHELQVHQIELETQAEELRRAQIALEESRDKYLDLYDFAPLGYLTLSDKALIEEVNLTGATLLGIERSKLINTRFRKFIAPEYFEAWDKYFLNVLDRGQKQSCPLVIMRSDGSTFPARLESIRISGKNNEDPTVRMAISDITYIRLAENALRISNKKLTLLSSITRHDIVNNLTVLTGSLELALNNIKKPELLITHINRAQKAAGTIQRQIDFTRVYDQIGVNAPVWQDCRALVENAVTQIALGKIVLKNDLPAGTKVFADPMFIKVFYNLIDNAVRYGGKITTIRFSAEEHGSVHVLVGEDDGDGVIAEDKERIFTRGFGKNTGLGLALARDILDITGITIRETGKPGKGARFEMTVPKGGYRFGEEQGHP